MAIDDDPEDRPDPCTTLEGWKSFADTPPAAFRLLDDDAWKSLSDPERAQYDDQRISYHSEFVVVGTSAVRSITQQGRLLIQLNRRERGARRGLIVSGLQTTGKSTAIKQLGLAHELKVRQRFPHSNRIPVVYVTCPPKGSPRKLASELARFLGIEPPARHNALDIADTVCGILRAAKNDLVIIDEIHNLNNGTIAGEDLSDHIKHLTEHLPATFVYAGIDVDHCGLFTGIRGRQIAGRCVQIDTAAFPYQTEWKSLVATMEQALRLHQHEPGSLVRQSRYLHRRTGGMIGSLSHLIRASAIIAIEDGTEQITHDILEAITLDKIAEGGDPGR